MKHQGVWLSALLVGSALGLGACEAFWREVDANVVELHQDKVSYMAEFREEEAKLRALVAQAEQAKSPPDLQLKAIGSYMRTAQAYREGLNRSLRFAREHEREIRRCGLQGMVEADLAKELEEQRARSDAFMARAKRLQAEVVKLEAAASGAPAPR